MNQESKLETLQTQTKAIKQRKRTEKSLAKTLKVTSGIFSYKKLGGVQFLLRFPMAIPIEHIQPQKQDGLVYRLSLAHLEPIFGLQWTNLKKMFGSIKIERISVFTSNFGYRTRPFQMRGHFCDKENPGSTDNSGFGFEFPNIESKCFSSWSKTGA